MINEQEFLQRRYRLQELITQRGASHFVATSSDSIFYLCGASFEALERPFFLIVPREGEPRLVVPFLERDHLKKAKNFITIKYSVIGTTRRQRTAAGIRYWSVTDN